MSEPRAVPTVASAAVAPMVRGAPRPVTVLAALPKAVYLEHADGLVALVSRDGVQLPNALVLTVPSSGRPLRGCRLHAAGTLGAGVLRLADLEARITRWFDPRPSLPAIDAEVLASRIEVASRSLASGPKADMPTNPLDATAAALIAGEAAAAVVAGRALLGRGPGLTPAGDDQLAGLVAGVQLLAFASGATTQADAARETGVALARLARDATTALSAALLGHAARGEVAAPAAGFLRALVGGDAVKSATRELLAVGSTSGADLATGLLTAARAMLTVGTVGAEVA